MHTILWSPKHLNIFWEKKSSSLLPDLRLCVLVQLYTFGCNDEGALGRDTSEEGTETEPALVEGLEKVVQVTAGDSHTAALTEDGRVFAFGNFRVYSLFIFFL